MRRQANVATLGENLQELRVAFLSCKCLYIWRGTRSLLYRNAWGPLSLITPTALKWMSFFYASIHFNREKSLRICHPGAGTLCSTGSMLFMTPKSRDCCRLVFCFVSNEPSVWNYIKETGSEPGTVRSGCVLRVKATCDPSAQLVIIRCSHWKSSYIYIYSVDWLCGNSKHVGGFLCACVCVME